LKRPTVIAVGGLSGTGKTAFARAIASRLTYQTMIERGREILGADRGVILDATFLRDDDRSMAERMAREAGAEWRFIECRLAPELVHKRIEERVARREGLSDATWEIYLRQREKSAVLYCESDTRRLALDTSGDLAATAMAASDWLRLLSSETISASTNGGGEK
jgi:predicted kinase